MMCNNCVFFVGGRCNNPEALLHNEPVSGHPACRDFAFFDRRRVIA